MSLMISGKGHLNILGGLFGSMRHYPIVLSNKFWVNNALEVERQLGLIIAKPIDQDLGPNLSQKLEIVLKKLKKPNIGSILCKQKELWLPVGWKASLQKRMR